MARRGENIYKRKDGRWEARYPKNYSSAGHIIYGYVYGHSYTEAKEKRIQKLTDTPFHSIKQGSTNNPDMIFHDLAEQWLASKRNTVKESTYVRYRYLYDKHIDIQCGETTLKQLKVRTVENSIRSKQKSTTQNGLAPKTVQDILSVYRLIIRYGIENHYLSVANEVDMLHIPVCKTMDAKSITVLPPKERVILEQYVLGKENIRHFGIIIAMYTGIRIGELCALRWADIDLKNGFMYINHTLQRLHDYSEAAFEKTKVVMGSPKTSTSTRIIPLSSFLIQKLSCFAASPHHYVLSNTEKPEEPRSYLYFYKRQLSLCGLPDYTFHTIRHTFATRCVEEGIDIKSLSEILGHANVKITMNRYVHPSMEIKRLQLERLSVTL